MASGNRPGQDDLSHYAKLGEAPGAIHVFLAMRIVEAAFVEAPRLGEAFRPSEDRVRLGQEPSLSFPPTTLADFRPPDDDQPGALTNRFFGFFGPNGPLPLHLTEYARGRLTHEKDSTFVAFADMLTHRLATLLYRAWRTGQPAPSFDRGEGSGIEARIAALSGYHGREQRGRDAMPDLAKRHFAGHLAAGPRSPEGLVSMLSSFFGSDVHLEEYVGCWLDLEPDDRWQLGNAAGLGQATSIGTKVWTRAAKFRLIVGPLSLEDYRRLLPGGDSLQRMAAIVRNYVGDTLEWEVNLVLRGDEVPAATLGEGSQLGLTSWIGGAAGRERVDDLFVSPQSDKGIAA